MSYLLIQDNICENSLESTGGIFDNIILAIKSEKERRQTKHLLMFFLLLFFISLAALPFSFRFLLSQWNSSGVSYFISNAMENFAMFSNLWQDFMLSILESLPIMGLVFFAINVGAILFSIRLFLYKKGLLLNYVKHSFMHT